MSFLIGIGCRGEGCHGRHEIPAGCVVVTPSGVAWVCPDGSGAQWRAVSTPSRRTLLMAGCVDATAGVDGPLAAVPISEDDLTIFRLEVAEGDLPAAAASEWRP